MIELRWRKVEDPDTRAAMPISYDKQGRPVWAMLEYRERGSYSGTVTLKPPTPWRPVPIAEE